MCNIITKWYINYFAISAIALPSEGNIITKWYINEKVTMYLQAKRLGNIITKWYINYRIYKRKELLMTVDMIPNALYAKSSPIKTIKEHTEEVREQMLLLKDFYGKTIESLIKVDKNLFWKALDIVICYHDVGKAYSLYQHDIKKNLGIDIYEKNFACIEKVRHNYISPALIDIGSMELSDKELIIIIFQAIVSHHSRYSMLDAKTLMRRLDIILQYDLSPKIDLIQEELLGDYKVSKHLSSAYVQYIKKPIVKTHPLYREYILIAGLLQRLDYTASAQEQIELNVDKNISEYVLNKLETLRELQVFCLKHNTKNLLLIGSTGLGKTEAALLWFDDNKGFFTLPYKSSLNAVYNRIKTSYGYDSVGLLHSTAMNYLTSIGESNCYKSITESRLLSQKLTISTIDQLFKFVLLPPAYERIYATLAYSKIVIDEMQAYDPILAAIIVKGLKMIHEVGGKFMIMTATMPSIYISKLTELGVIDDNLHSGVFYSNTDRHKLKLKEMSIVDNIDFIIQQAKCNKVVVFANTVKEAINIFEVIQSKTAEDNINCNLLHARFILKDKQRLEKEIQVFSDASDLCGLWVTTNIAEASLDIDFDIAHIEFSTLDSLFQRFGRCNRKGLQEISQENIYIYTDASGIGSVYDEEIHNISIDLLNEHIVSKGNLLSEKDKQDLVSELYSFDKIKKTKFYLKFNDTFDILNSIEPYEISSKKAQNILRRIDSCKIIPKPVFKDIESTIIKEFKQICVKLSEAKLKGDKVLVKELTDKKSALHRKLNMYTVDIGMYNIKNEKLSTIGIKELDYIKVLDCEYDNIKGVIL